MDVQWNAVFGLCAALGAGALAVVVEHALESASSTVHPRRGDATRARKALEATDGEPGLPARQALKPDVVLLRRPAIALPTLALAVAAFGTWLWAWHLATGPRANAGLAWVVASLSAYFSFTPLHEAVHGSVASGRLAFMNGVVGALGGIPLFTPYQFFKVVHLGHHRNLNVPGLDPDMWSARPDPWYKLLFRFITTAPHYVVYTRILQAKQPSARTDQLLAQAAAAFTALLVVAVGLTGAIGWAVPQVWLGGAVAGTALAQFNYDFLPHRPATVDARTNPFKATHTIAPRNLVVAVLFVCQNYHTGRKGPRCRAPAPKGLTWRPPPWRPPVHHLWPQVPWYRMPAMHARYHKDMLKLGTREVPLLGAAVDHLGEYKDHLP